MDSDHQVVALGRLVDRPVVALAERHLGTHQQKYLHEAGMIAKPVDFFRSHLGILGGYDDGGPKAWLLIEPLGHLPVVYGPGHGRPPVLVVDQLDAVQAVEDGALDVPRIEELPPQEVKIRTRRATRGGHSTRPSR